MIYNDGCKNKRIVYSLSSSSYETNNYESLNSNNSCSWLSLIDLNDDILKVTHSLYNLLYFSVLYRILKTLSSSIQNK